MAKSSRLVRPPARRSRLYGVGWSAGLGCRARRPMASALVRGERTAVDLLAGALGHVEPSVGLRVLLGRAGTGRGRGLAIVLAGLGDAEALLGRGRLSLHLRGEQ